MLSWDYPLCLSNVEYREISPNYERDVTKLKFSRLRVKRALQDFVFYFRSLITIMDFYVFIYFGNILFFLHMCM